jgi:hypothetical protein
VPFTVAISGSVSGTGDARTFALSFAGTAGAVSGDFAPLQADCPGAGANSGAEAMTLLAPVTVPALPGTTAITSSILSGTLTLAPLFSQ